ncbi:MAG: DUF1566 domain-containing protein [Geobacteraceae bacterium]|nr:DUF1566 domain-containing protein [Geobacteraceae bacterium]
MKNTKVRYLLAVLMVLILSAVVAFAGETARDGRFIAYGTGTVLDTKTNLMWAAQDNGSDINWEDAKSYCKHYRGGDYTDWRMPKQDELAMLYDETLTDNKYMHKTNLIELTSAALWASDVFTSEVAVFAFFIGSRHWTSPSGSLNLRVLPVRSVK